MVVTNKIATSTVTSSHTTLGSVSYIGPHLHKPEYVLENETQKILWDFDVQTDHLISAGRELVI